MAPNPRPFQNRSLTTARSPKVFPISTCSIRHSKSGIQHHGIDYLTRLDRDLLLDGVQYACPNLCISKRWRAPQRSEEHTSELQSLLRISSAVFSSTNQTTS